MSGFHAREGWYFERAEDGSVVIQRRIPVENPVFGPQDGWPVEHVRLDPATWASVVASVSARGEDAQTFGWARTLHDGGIRVVTAGQVQVLIRAAVTHGLTLSRGAG